MLTTNRARLQERRGIALILILGMLGLLAFIGVTFATISGQARIGAQNYVQSVMRPQPADLMEFALSQLIGDTDDYRSAIRGHSMARDMYGNDAQSNGYLDQNSSGRRPAQLPVRDVGAAGVGRLCGDHPVRHQHSGRHHRLPAALRLQFHAVGGPVPRPVGKRRPRGRRRVGSARPSRSSTTTRWARRAGHVPDLLPRPPRRRR